MVSNVTRSSAWRSATTGKGGNSRSTTSFTTEFMCRNTLLQWRNSKTAVQMACGVMVSNPRLCGKFSLRQNPRKRSLNIALCQSQIRGTLYTLRTDYGRLR
jgi:hypothetical protein